MMSPRARPLQIMHTLLPLLDAGTQFVLTLKNFAGGRAAFAGEVEGAMEALRAIGDDLRSSTLMANSRHEVTVVGVLRPDAVERAAAGGELHCTTRVCSTRASGR